MLILYKRDRLVYNKHEVEYGTVCKNYKRIRDLREDKDLTQKQLAEYLNVSQKSYSRYERGERTIDPEILSKLATFHETTVDYLIERTDDKTDYTKKKRR